MMMQHCQAGPYAYLRHDEIGRRQTNQAFFHRFYVTEDGITERGYNEPIAVLMAAHGA
jgi:hypothetical protein